MIDLTDPDMKEIVDEFCDESDGLLEQLRDFLDNFEDDSSQSHLLEEFGQTIDRIMGAAQTLGADDIGELCHMGKIIGYKSSQSKQVALQEVSAGVLFDLCDFLEVLLVNIRKDESYSDLNYKTFRDRLQWLVAKFKDIDRASCSFEENASESPDKSIKVTAELEQLISQFGKAS